MNKTDLISKGSASDITHWLKANDSSATPSMGGGLVEYGDERFAEGCYITTAFFAVACAMFAGGRYVYHKLRATQIASAIQPGVTEQRKQAEDVAEDVAEVLNTAEDEVQL